jgi:IS30 family transposase
MGIGRRTTMKSISVRELAKELNRPEASVIYWLTDKFNGKWGVHTRVSQEEANYIRTIEPHKARKKRSKKKKKSKKNSIKSVKLTKKIRDAIKYLVSSGEYDTYEQLAHAWEMNANSIYKYLNGDNKFVRRSTWEKMRFDIEDAMDEMKADLEHAAEMEVGIYNADAGIRVVDGYVVITDDIIKVMRDLISDWDNCQTLAKHWNVGDDSIYKWINGSTKRIAKKTWEKIGPDIVTYLLVENSGRTPASTSIKKNDMRRTCAISAATLLKRHEEPSEYTYEVNISVAHHRMLTLLQYNAETLLQQAVNDKLQELEQDFHKVHSAIFGETG